MTRITLDEDLRRKLLNLTQDLEICDACGNVIARVVRSTPLTDPDNWEQLGPELSEEEWERIKDSDNPGVTTAELIAHLKTLD